MRPRERIQAVLRGQQPDRVPRAINFYPWSFPQYPRREAAEVIDSEVRFVTIDAPQEQRHFLRYLDTLPRDTYVGSAAILRTYHDWGYHPEIERDAPLGDAHTVAQIGAAPLPDFMRQVRPDRLRRTVERIHEQGYAVMASPPHLGGELFETAWRLRGFDQFMIDLIDNPPLVDYLLDQLTAMHMAVSLALVRSGIDILALDDDIAEYTRLLISPAHWRRFFKPRLKALIEVCRAANPELFVFWHSDGNIEQVIPDLIEIGVNVLNPVQPDAMDPARLKRLYGRQLAFWGTVGTAQRWAWASPAEIRAEVHERIVTVGEGGGLIVSPAYDLEPEFRWENVEAMVKAVDEFGQYDA